jgi:hypothetical protein
LEGVIGVYWGVDGDLLVVYSESVSLRVGIRKEAALQHGVGGGFDAWDQVAGREGDLFYFSEIVLWLDFKSN